MKAYIAPARFFSGVGLTTAGAAYNADSAASLDAADNEMKGKSIRRLSEAIPNAVVFITSDNELSSLQEIEMKVEDGYIYGRHGSYFYPLCAV